MMQCPHRPIEPHPPRSTPLFKWIHSPESETYTLSEEALVQGTSHKDHLSGRQVRISEIGVWLFGNRALVWYLAGIDYEMPKLGSDDLVLGAGLRSWSTTVALHVSLNSGVEAALMCLDLLRLPSCTRNPYVVLNLANRVVKPSHNQLSLFHTSKEFTQTSLIKPLAQTVSDIGPLVAALPALHSLKTVLSSSVEEVCPLDSSQPPYAVSVIEPQTTFIPITNRFVDLSDIASKEDCISVMT
ncbi:hypothetical protein M9H77_17451 [Catharanthus roseus]|uniref:Uncharacterized protein n=1 Tax=Catharanthus roseus TaxID=4058 RepID=A0ACC0B4Z7_CATRO|nr:hypothetical protein M9H77_17451 [Catharanthus roseus]